MYIISKLLSYYYYFIIILHDLILVLNKTYIIIIIIYIYIYIYVYNIHNNQPIDIYKLSENEIIFFYKNNKTIKQIIINHI